MNALVLALTLCQLDGGTAPGTDVPLADAGIRAPIVVMDVVSGALVVRPEDGGTPALVHVGDGCYAPTDSCMRIAKEHASDEGELDSARTVGLKWLGVAFGAGALTGLAVGLVAGFAAKK